VCIEREIDREEEGERSEKDMHENIYKTITYS
jgi:hypothetical protein